MKRIFVLLILFILVPFSTATAAPDITSVVGTVDGGEIITITGTGFGSKTTAPPLISSFDSAISANNWNTGTIGSNWYQQYAGEQWLENTTNIRVPGSHVMEMDARGDYSVIGYSHMSPDSTMYVSWWQYFDYDQFHQVTGNGNNAKFMRMWPGATGGNGPVFSNQAEAADGTFRKSYETVEGAPPCPSWVLEYTATNATASALSSFIVNFGDADIINTMRQWVHWEAYFTFNTPGAEQDEAIIIKDGQTVVRSTSIALIENGEVNNARMVRIGAVTGDRTESQMEYVDHIYYDNSFAHAFITDSPTNTFPDMATVQHTEVQVASTWSDTSVTITVNKGSLPDGPAYLYVMDSTGAINTNGYAITLGASWDSTPVNINNSTYSHDLHTVRSHDGLARDGNNLFAVTPYHSGGRVEVWKSTDNGATWATMGYYTTVDQASILRGADGYIYIFGRASGQFNMVRFASSATSIPAPVNIGAITDVIESSYVMVTSTINEAGTLFVTSDNASGDIIQLRSTDNGTTWSNPTAIATHQTGHDWYNAQCAVSSDNEIYCNYNSNHSTANGSREMHLLHSTDNGVTYSDTLMYTGDMINAHILTDGDDNVYFFGQNQFNGAPGNGVVLSKSSNSGTSWSAFELVEGTCYYADMTAALTANGTVVLAMRGDNGTGTDGTPCGESCRQMILESDTSVSTWTEREWLNALEQVGTQSRLRYHTWHTGGGILEWMWMQYTDSGSYHPIYYNNNENISIAVVGANTCDAQHLNLCTTDGTCTTAGGHFCNGVCQAAVCDVVVPGTATRMLLNGNSKITFGGNSKLIKR